ncbi:MAG: Crp/Fnr family transcriptional regulator [Mollicutes bacterium]|nr:Crp/Fnr family transcriptional regulator [Mollicutes bacterium]MDD7043679.1 Crp/Fnr family transcriptional regulator [Mollicutes bacterium]MDY6071160.1 Crp/Fnr family transcriptional regulator [Bacilli bacterium]
MKTLLDDITLERCAKAHPSFVEELNDEMREKILEKMIFSSYEKGEVLFQEGDKADCLYIIRQGNIKLATYDGEGREQIVSIFSPGDTIWVALFLKGKKDVYPYNGIFLDKAIVGKMARDDFESLIQDTHSALEIIALLSKKLSDANERNLILSVSDPKAKIARLFLYRLNHISGNIVKLKLEDIAAHVSLRPETVSRKLGELLNDKILEKVGQSSFRILNYEKLVHISQN